MIALQVLAILFALVMMYITKIHFNKENIGKREFQFWVVMWIAFIIIALFPQTMTYLGERLHIWRVFDLLVVIALMILIFFTFQNRIYYRRLEKKLERMTRDWAIHEKKRKSSKN